MPRNNCLSCEPVDRSEVEAEIARIQSLNIDALRLLWRETIRTEVPPSLTKDLLARMLAWHVQEQAFGGFDSATLKTLDGYVRGRSVESDRIRRLKPGTELVREYQRERHTVTVSRDGFIWRGTTYKSLTTIARAITGTNWNGPRFFGLRDCKAGARHASSPARINPAQKPSVTAP